MSNHTKAPWLFDGKVVYALNEKGVNIFSAFVQDGKTCEDELKANARRIVACVNACEGISTEMLESVQINPSMLLSMYSRLESERTELEKRLNDFAQENMDHFSRINDLEQKLKSEMRRSFRLVADQRKKQMDDLLYRLDLLVHKTGCRKNEFGHACTCGLDEIIASAIGGAA